MRVKKEKYFTQLQEQAHELVTSNAVLRLKVACLELQQHLLRHEAQKLPVPPPPPRPSAFRPFVRAPRTGPAQTQTKNAVVGYEGVPAAERL